LLLPVSTDVAAPTIAFCPSHAVIAETALLMSGRAYGSGTELPPPPV
jgi:hypothetical protein